MLIKDHFLFFFNIGPSRDWKGLESDMTITLRYRSAFQESSPQSICMASLMLLLLHIAVFPVTPFLVRRPDNNRFCVAHDVLGMRQKGLFFFMHICHSCISISRMLRRTPSSLFPAFSPHGSCHRPFPYLLEKLIEALSNSPG